MADANITTPQTAPGGMETAIDAKVAGGKACMEALRTLEFRVEGVDAATPEFYFSAKDAIISDFTVRAGEISPRAAGFIETLVEFAFTAMEVGEPDLDHWKSKASMNEAELSADRKRFADSWNGAEVSHV